MFILGFGLLTGNFWLMPILLIKKFRNLGILNLHFHFEQVSRWSIRVIRVLDFNAFWSSVHENLMLWYSVYLGSFIFMINNLMQNVALWVLNKLKMIIFHVFIISKHVPCHSCINVHYEVVLYCTEF